MSESPVADGAAMLDAANAGGSSDNPTPVADNSPPAVPSQPVVNNTGGAKPYQAQLEKLPEGFRPMVEPIFQEWDSNVGKRLDEVHSRYAPYKQFLDAQVNPAQMQEAMRLYEVLSNNPQRVYEALHEQFGQQGGQGQVDEGNEFDLGEEDSEQFDITQHPRFQQLEQQQQQFIEAMQQAAQAREQQQAAAEADQWMETKINETTQKLTSAGIEADPRAMNYILSVAGGLGSAGMPHDEAIAKATDDFINMYGGIRQKPYAGQSAPVVMPTGGGTPSTGLPDFSNDKDRRSAGAEMLRAAFRNG